MTVSGMTFTGIPVEALDFYEGLEADNTKSYWTAHKAVYDEAVRAPMIALAEALAPEFGMAKVFRPYNDVRFRKDKSPYKTAQGAAVGDSEGGEGVLYVQVSAAGLLVAAGYYHLAPDQLARYREAADDERRGEDLRGLLDRLGGSGFEVGGDRMKTRPRGVPADHPRVELLRMRSVHVWRESGSSPWLHTAEAVEVVAAAWRAAAPLNEWLSRHVGATTAPRRR